MRQAEVPCYVIAVLRCNVQKDGGQPMCLVSGWDDRPSRLGWAFPCTVHKCGIKLLYGWKCSLDYVEGEFYVPWDAQKSEVVDFEVQVVLSEVKVGLDSSPVTYISLRCCQIQYSARKCTGCTYGADTDDVHPRVEADDGVPVHRRNGDTVKVPEELCSDIPGGEQQAADGLAQNRLELSIESRVGQTQCAVRGGPEADVVAPWRKWLVSAPADSNLEEEHGLGEEDGLDYLDDKLHRELRRRHRSIHVRDCVCKRCDCFRETPLFCNKFGKARCSFFKLCMFGLGAKVMSSLEVMKSVEKGRDEMPSENCSKAQRNSGLLAA